MPMNGASRRFFFRATGRGCKGLIAERHCRNFSISRNWKTKSCPVSLPGRHISFTRNLFQGATTMNTMDAFVLNEVGSVDNLSFEKVDVPQLGSNEIAVRVHACGVCHRDILDRKGAFPFILLPAILGHEIAGVVERCGTDVQNLRPGDKVVSLHWAPCQKCPECREGNFTACEYGKTTFLGLTKPGGYAEYAVTGEYGWVKVPSGFSAVDAASVMCTYGTVWRAAIKRGRLQKGETVLVTGASGGVGSSMIQIAKAMGCNVIAVTSNAGKESYLKQLGADHVIVGQLVPERDAGGSILAGGKTTHAVQFHKSERLKNVKVDMVFEGVGAPTFNSSLRSLRQGGRLVLIGNVSVGSVDLKLGYVILNSIEIIGSDSCSAQELEETFEFLKAHKIRPRIAHLLRLDQVKEAHRMLESKEVNGRIVLKLANKVDDEMWKNPRVQDGKL